MQNTALPVFLYDFSKYYVKHPGMGFDETRSYALNYHTHYHIYISNHSYTLIYICPIGMYYIQINLLLPLSLIIDKLSRGTSQLPSI